MASQLSDWVGRYKLVLSRELLDFIEKTFVEPREPAERAAVRAQALHEARGAELEIFSDGRVISRSHAEQFFGVKLPLEAFRGETLRFEKAPGVPVALERQGPGVLVAHQPGKPPALFEAVA